MNFKKTGIMSKKRMKMLDMRQAVNRFGIEVKKCCASCAFKSITNDVALRRCNLHRHKVRPHNCCRAWRMSEGLRHAGVTPPPYLPPSGRLKTPTANVIPSPS